ncbi:MAG TPA: TolC family protein [Gemmatimonadaceae bacterium]|nr:TolC family protein [Gemmatimonadaceae bacterium]
MIPSQRFNISRHLAAAIPIVVASAIGAQQPTPPSLGQPVRLSLGDAARLAAHQSNGVQSAEQRVAEAVARVRQSRAALLPELSANALQSGRTFNSVTFGITLPSAPGQPPLFNPEGEVLGPVNTLDLRGRVQANLMDPAAIARLRTAQTAVDVARADIGNAGDIAASQAAVAYIRVQRGNAQLSARLADSVLARELLNIAQSQLEAGVGVALDVTRAQSQLAGIRAQLISARNERDRAQLDLRRALNLSLDTPVELTDSLTSVVPEDLTLDEAAATARALRDRPDLRAAEEQLRAARQTVSAIRAERLPSISAFGDEGTIGKSGSNRLLPTYTYGVQLSLPIFDGFRREGRIQEQEAATRELDVRRRDLEQQASIDVRGALLDLAAAKEALTASRERLRLAEQEVAQARERFRAGVAGNADVVTAALTLNAARSQYVDVLTALQQARVSLARAEGAVTQLR